jgi:hypothetical protein
MTATNETVGTEKTRRLMVNIKQDSKEPFTASQAAGQKSKMFLFLPTNTNTALQVRTRAEG